MGIGSGTVVSVDAPVTARLLRSLAVRALRRMYLPGRRLFAFRIRRTANGDWPEGVSRRYTAIALIGLATEPPPAARRVLYGQRPADACSRLAEDLGATEDLGQVALTLWACRALAHPAASRALQRLRALQPGRTCTTVELAWALAALSIQADAPCDDELAGAIAQRLATSLRPRSGLFPHWPAGVRGRWLRAHVTCLADQVYPIHALSLYHQATGQADAIEAARCCAERICQLQGAQGQWWWHYDVRTARLIERYPVYAVHQDSMVPMAFRALTDAGGGSYGRAVSKGLAWLTRAPEIGGSLIDPWAGLIWRKVARHEPGKLVRGLQAASSRLHPALRAPAAGLIFRPGQVDYESRPYHMGWILHAWPAVDRAPGSGRQR